MSRRYHYLTKKLDAVYTGPGQQQALEWHTISPMTRDPNIRAAIPGEYAIVRDMDLVYILPHNNPARKSSRKK